MCCCCRCMLLWWIELRVVFLLLLLKQVFFSVGGRGLSGLRRRAKWRLGIGNLSHGRWASADSIICDQKDIISPRIPRTSVEKKKQKFLFYICTSLRPTNYDAFPPFLYVSLFNFYNYSKILRRFFIIALIFSSLRFFLLLATNES
jgi:hypothetical protein